MAFPTVSESGANALPGTFTDVFARPTGGKYQTLGGIMDASWSLTSFSKGDSKKRNKVNSASEFIATFKMKQASTVELLLLTALQNGDNDFLFRCPDAAVIPSTTPAATAGWVLVTKSQVDAKCKVDWSGDSAENAFIEVTVHGTVLNSAKDTCLKASIADTQFESSSDSGTFHGIGTYTPTANGGSPKNANMKCCGITKVELAYTGGGNQDLTRISNFKFTADFVGKPDSIKRQCVTSVDFDIEYDWDQTDAATLLTVDSMDSDPIDVIVTTLSAVVFTFTDQTGIDTKVDAPTDISAPRVIHFKHTGSIAKATFTTPLVA
jgi:hypothetical protein